MTVICHQTSTGRPGRQYYHDSFVTTTVCSAWFRGSAKTHRVHTIVVTYVQAVVQGKQAMMLEIYFPVANGKAVVYMRSLAVEETHDAPLRLAGVSHED